MSSSWDKALAKVRKRQPEITPRTEAELDDAERRLGERLPAAYRALCLHCGLVTWPVLLFGLDQLEYGAERETQRIVIFGSDGGELQYAFDMRQPRTGEPQILTIDLERPRYARVDAKPFRAWFSDRLAAVVADEKIQSIANLKDDLDTLLNPEARLPQPWMPNDEEVADAERRLGVKLPRDYRIFCTHVGAIRWPLTIVEATGIADLARELREDVGVVMPDDLVPIAHDDDFVYGFRRDGVRVHACTREGEVTDLNLRFIPWLTARVQARRER